MCLSFSTPSLSSLGIIKHYQAMMIQDVSTMFHTIPLRAATCLAGFALLQVLFSSGSW
ncbi:hypothetical protein [Synechococcus sp. Cruz CV-v-12]|uniref:hypothetical protein n=1 Tax=Synechococcus sp. Cruz CV-v-12 TaxID=2823728 RepID=UPI0020CC7248|nr:hypothetical protein [Synechococcus sp. Cruz CV-v-12]MCP9874915.1 hypothetical protein [Synechococcus sp. Cruz CV-v-12]